MKFAYFSQMSVQTFTRLHDVTSQITVILICTALSSLSFIIHMSSYYTDYKQFHFISCNRGGTFTRTQKHYLPVILKCQSSIKFGIGI